MTILRRGARARHLVPGHQLVLHGVWLGSLSSLLTEYERPESFGSAADSGPGALREKRVKASVAASGGPVGVGDVSRPRRFLVILNHESR
jgi:hypothetical protein